jgi:hypothetical protein
MGILSLGFNFGMAYWKNIGASIIYNDKYFSEIYMSPLYHFSSFFLGINVCLIYKEWLENI